MHQHSRQSNRLPLAITAEGGDKENVSTNQRSPRRPKSHQRPEAQPKSAFFFERYLETTLGATTQNKEIEEVEEEKDETLNE